MDHQEVDNLDTKISILSDGIRKAIETSNRQPTMCKHGYPSWQRCGVCIVEDLESVLEDAGCEL